MLEYRDERRAAENIISLLFKKKCLVCCVPMCNGRGGHKFPADTVERKRWIQAVKRGEQNWSPSRWSKVCRAHFEELDYETKTTENDGMKLHILKPGVVPHLFPWKRPNLHVNSRAMRSEKRQKTVNHIDTETCFTDLSNGVINEVEIEMTIS